MRLRDRTASVVAGLAVLLATSACTAEPSPTTRLDAGEVETLRDVDLDVTATAEVGTPSGVLQLGLAPDLTSLSVDSGTVEATGDGTLVGLRLTFQRHPSSSARDVLLGSEDPLALPVPTVSLVYGSDAVEVPVPDHAGPVVSVAVGADDPSRVEVAYDGVTQVVDLATGTVDAGPAGRLVDLAATSTELDRRCDARDFPRDDTTGLGCQVAAVHRLPYVAQLGWAPDDGEWLVVDARIDGSARILLGDRRGTSLEGAPASIERVAFAVSGDGPRVVHFRFGGDVGTVSVALGAGEY